MSMNYYLLTLGCQMNKSDSERISTILEDMGYQPVDDEKEADLLGVVACSVRQKAIDKVYSKIYKWNRTNDNRNLITFLTGCILPADKKKFMNLFDLVFTTNALPDFPTMLKQYGVVTPLSVPSLVLSESGRPKGNTFPSLTKIAKDNTTAMDEKDKRTIMDRLWEIKPTYHSDFEAFVPIQNGCDKFCTFCVVPYTRGREVSRSSTEILEEIRSLINREYKSITLLGQNVNSYGKDKPGKELSFARLLEEIGKIGEASGKRCWIYFTSPHPRDMKPEVIDVIARYSCLAKQIHLPLQSGDDEVLKRMNRKYTLENYRKIVHYIREKLPEATLFTDIIVGFPGETEDQFENTRKALNEFRYNMAYIAIYSPRPGTVSARWDDDIPVTIKKDRLHQLTKELEKSALLANQTLLGKTTTILVTGKDRKAEYLSGHTEGRIKIRFPSPDVSLIGHFVRVKIISVTPFSVAGEIIKVGEEEWLPSAK